MTTKLTTRPEFFKKVPENFTLSGTKTIITNSIKTGTIKIAADSNITFVALLSEGWSELQKLQFNFEEENSTLNFVAFIVGKNENKFPFETISHHTATHTNAYYHLRSAMFDKSEVNYTGKLNIKPSAQLTDSYLAHHTLMLSKDAKVHTIPSLEIEADDVKAGHAATIGKMDEDLIFYLESRGIDKKTGQDLLVKGFMETDLKQIPNETLRKMVSEEIENSLSC